MDVLAPLSLFAGYGIELEYMIVDKDTLNILPITDLLLNKASKSNEYPNEVVNGEIGWSNELALHIVELKNIQPSSNLTVLNNLFSENINEINMMLAKFNARLLPTGIHPWMNPKEETKVWPHENVEIYDTYHRIFNCFNHGWSNVQSVHLNLPFANDKEFAKLHSAIRILLPIIPALSASSPIYDLQFCGYKDSRLFFYEQNQKNIPSITDGVIPKEIFSKKEYEDEILNKIYADINSYDPGGILQYEWLNSRGAIARFERNAIEIRIMDVQECPVADLAISALVISTLKNILIESTNHCSLESLQQIFQSVIKHGFDAMIEDRRYLECFEINKDRCSVKEVWWYLWEKLKDEKILDDFKIAIETILNYGSLAERILKVLHNDFAKANVRKVYLSLAECLVQNELFLP